jgi:hypothetical protein
MDSERSGQTLAFGILMNFTSEYRYLAIIHGRGKVLLVAEYHPEPQDIKALGNSRYA